MPGNRADALLSERALAIEKNGHDIRVEEERAHLSAIGNTVFCLRI